MLIIATILFILLSPGMIITLPPVGKLLFSEETNNLAILVHSAIYYLILKLTMKDFPIFKYLKLLENELRNPA